MHATTLLPLAVLLAANMLLATAAQANDSAYTDLNLDNCQTIEADAMGASLLCKGFNGLQVHFKEGDLRHSVLFGPVGRELQHGAFESFSAFNRVNDKVEWRRDASGKPFAAILRWFIENPGPDGSPSPESTGQVLVISRVATPDYPGSCFVGMVDAKANADANLLARQVADQVTTGFDCGMELPVWHGERGQLTSDRTFSWPEGYVVE